MQRLVVCLAALVACGDRSFSLATGEVLPGRSVEGPAVVVFDRALRASDREALVSVGLAPIAPLGGAWLVTGDADRAADLAGVAWAGPVPAQGKVDPALRGGSDVVAVAHLAPGADARAVGAAVVAAGLPVSAVGRRVVSPLSGAQVEAWIEVLADRPDVVWLGRRGRRELLDQSMSVVGQSGLASSGTPFFDVGLNGAGQIGGLIDTGIDVDHCMFSDPALFPAVNTSGTEVEAGARKVIAVDFLWSEDDSSDPGAWDDQSHGTHVAGVLAGDDDADGQLDVFDGTGLGAKLVVQDAGTGADNCADLPGLGCDVADLVPVFEQAYAQGVRVHSNSWGDREASPVTSTYSDGSQDVDEVSWAHPDYLLVFAAGNTGDAGQVFSPGNAKNSLSVGATLPGVDSATMMATSTGGPTFDGRNKPDLVFPGVATSALTDLDITTGNCQVFSLSGTSIAAPGAAGLALVTRQYFADGWYPSGAPVAADGFSPSSALVKGALIASTEPVEGTFAFTGYGRPQLDRVLPIDPAAPRRLLVVDEATDRSFNGAGDPSFKLAFHVDDAAESLRVALVWRDPPGVPMAERLLVNDLDLTLRGLGGTWYGNAISEFWSVIGGVPDRENNVEVVRLVHPTVGDYEVEVSAHEIGLGPQPFALVVSGAVTEIPVEVETGTTGETGAPPVGETGETGAEDTDPPPVDTSTDTDDGGGCSCDAAGPSGGWLALAAVTWLRRSARRSGTTHAR
ncbi:MAG: S8 family serine peptidase [Myxococcota bacterium]